MAPHRAEASPAIKKVVELEVMVMAITLIVHHSSGASQLVSLESPVNVEPNSRIEFRDVNGAEVGPLVSGDDSIVRHPNGDGETTLASFQALHGADAEAPIGWSDGGQAAQADGAVAGGDLIAYVLIHTIGETGDPDVRRYDIKSGDEILVHPKQIVEFPFTSGDQMRFTVDGDHLVIRFPDELGFLTLRNFQKLLLDPEATARLEWGLGGHTIASVEDVLAQLAPAAAGIEALTSTPPEAGVATADGSGITLDDFIEAIAQVAHERPHAVGDGHDWGSQAHGRGARVNQQQAWLGAVWQALSPPGKTDNVTDFGIGVGAFLQQDILYCPQAVTY